MVTTHVSISERSLSDGADGDGGCIGKVLGAGEGGWGMRDAQSTDKTDRVAVVSLMGVRKMPYSKFFLLLIGMSSIAAASTSLSARVGGDGPKPTVESLSDLQQMGAMIYKRSAHMALEGSCKSSKYQKAYELLKQHPAHMAFNAINAGKIELLRTSKIEVPGLRCDTQSAEPIQDAITLHEFDDAEVASESLSDVCAYFVGSMSRLWMKRYNLSILRAKPKLNLDRCRMEIDLSAPDLEDVSSMSWYLEGK